MFNIYTFNGVTKDYVNLSGKHYFIMTVGDSRNFEAQVVCKSLKKALSILHHLLNGVDYSLENVYTVTNSKGKTSVRILKDMKNENQA